MGRPLPAPNGSSAPGSARFVVIVAAGNTDAVNSIQGLADNGTVQASASAPGYVGTSGNHPLVPSGLYLSTGSFSTMTLSPNTNLSVCFTKLNPGKLTNAGGVPTRPGLAGHRHCRGVRQRVGGRHRRLPGADCGGS